MKNWKQRKYETLSLVWQYKTLSVMTAWNIDSHDSMKHWKQWRYATLTAVTVWNVESRDSMEHWQHFNIKTLTVMTVWKIRNRWAWKPDRYEVWTAVTVFSSCQYYFQPHRGLRTLLFARLHIYKPTWRPREVCSRVTTVRCTECVHHHDVRVFPTAHEWDSRLRTQSRIVITFSLSLLLT